MRWHLPTRRRQQRRYGPPSGRQKKRSVKGRRHRLPLHLALIGKQFAFLLALVFLFFAFAVGLLLLTALDAVNGVILLVALGREFGVLAFGFPGLVPRMNQFGRGQGRRDEKIHQSVK